MQTSLFYSYGNDTSYKITVYYTHKEKERYVSLSVIPNGETLDIKDFIDGIFESGMELYYMGENVVIDLDCISSIDCEKMTKEETRKLNELFTICKN